MSRRTSQSSISLFPFLAVLVCTMGALILLLLVTTRRIRNDQVRWTERFQVTARVADENGLTKVTDEADFVIEPKRDVLHDGLTEEQRRELTALREQLQAEQEKYDQLQEQLGDSQSQLQVALDDREALRDRAEKLAELRRKEQQIRRTLEERAAELAGLQEELEDVSESTEQAQKVLRTRKSALVSLRKLVSEKSQSDSGTTGTVIEFSNSTGTKRTPLLINVSDDGFRFLPSGIRLTAADMQGFPSNDNPLVSGVLSIHQLRHHDSGAIKPYVLLLVRPSGSMQFYLAQRCLKDAGIQFGYELLAEDRSIAAGTADPDEMNVLRESILAALKRRQDLYGAVGHQLASNSRDPGSETSGGIREGRVLPDGRVLLPGESDPHQDDRFFAGDRLPDDNRIEIFPAPKSDRSGGGESEVQFAQDAASSDDNTFNPAARFGSPGDTVVADGQDAFDELLESASDDSDSSDVLAELKRNQMDAQNALAAAMQQLTATSGDIGAPADLNRVRANQRMLSGNLGMAFSGTSENVPLNSETSRVDVLFGPALSLIDPSDGDPSGKTSKEGPPSSAAALQFPQSPSDRPESVNQKTDPATRTVGSAEGSFASGAGTGTAASGAVGNAQARSNADAESPGWLDQFLSQAGRDSQRPDPWLKKILDRAKDNEVARQPITITVEKSRVQVGSTTPIELSGDTSGLLAETLTRLNSEVARATEHSLQAKPPVAVFDVRPGGVTTYLRLERELREMGITTRSNVSMPPANGQLSSPQQSGDFGTGNMADESEAAEESSNPDLPPRLDRRIAL